MVISVVAYCKDSIYPLSHGISNNELSMLVTMTMSIDYFMSILTGTFLGELGLEDIFIQTTIKTEICIHSAETYDCISKSG